MSFQPLGLPTDTIQVGYLIHHRYIFINNTRDQIYDYKSTMRLVQGKHLLP